MKHTPTRRVDLETKVISVNGFGCLEYGALLWYCTIYARNKTG